MKLTVLDGVTLNPGDLSWDGLRALADCTIHERTPAAEIVARAVDAELVLTNKTALPRAIIEQLPRLRYIGVLATGYNVVDVAAAAARGIPVTHVPTYGTQSVAQMVFAHILNLTQHVAHHAETVRAGRWAACPDFCYWDTPLIELSGLTLGLIGYGRIGRAVGAVGRAFGMRVLAYSPRGVAGGHDVRGVDVDAVFRESDVVSLHCPLTPDNAGLVNAARLALMKPTAFLINTSRGPLIVEDALAEALNNGRLAGAGLDVLADEPPGDSPLLTARNCCITPHIAWATQAARSRLLTTVIDNVRAFLAGTPRNVVNAPSPSS